MRPLGLRLSLSSDARGATVMPSMLLLPSAMGNLLRAASNRNTLMGSAARGLWRRTENREDKEEEEKEELKRLTSWAAK